MQPELERLADEVPATDVMSRAERAEAIAGENESYLGILTAMFGLCLVVGVLGVVAPPGLVQPARVGSRRARQASPRVSVAARTGGLPRVSGACCPWP